MTIRVPGTNGSIELKGGDRSKSAAALEIAGGVWRRGAAASATATKPASTVAMGRLMSLHRVLEFGMRFAEAVIGRHQLLDIVDFNWHERGEILVAALG